MKYSRKLIFIIISFFLVSLIINLTVLDQKKEIRFATWIWYPGLLETERTEIMEFVEEKQVKEIYLKFNDYISFETYRLFIAEMHQLDIDVHALDGSPGWGIIEDNYEHLEFMRQFKHYQSLATDEEKFKGIHLDIEPYLLPEWETDRAKIVSRYQHIIEQVVIESNHMDIPVSLDIPFWLDEITYNNSYGKGFLAKWLLQNVDEVTIMAYRNFAEEKNGIIDISKQEIQWANELGKSVMIAVETQELPEEHTTFFQHNLQYMNKQLELVAQHFRKDSSFSGFAIHHYYSWKEMKD